MTLVRIAMLVGMTLLLVVSILLFMVYLVLKTIGLLIVIPVNIVKSFMKTLNTKSHYSESNSKVKTGMVLRDILNRFFDKEYKGGIVTLYVSMISKDYIIGELDGEDINEELISTIELAKRMERDFLVVVFPNPVEDSLKLLEEIKSHEDSESISIKIPTFGSTEETGGGTLLLCFSVLFAGFLLLIYDHKEFADSLMVGTEKEVQITH